MKIKFPKLAPHQQIVYDAVKDGYNSGKIFVVKSRRQVGKTTLACILLIYYALKRKCRSIVIEPSNINNRNVYAEIKRWLINTGLVDKFNDTYNEIIFTNGSVISFKSAESRDNLRGDHCNGILIIDEAAFISDNIINIVLPYVDVSKAPILMISTPMFKDGAFYNFFTNCDNELSFSFDWATFDMSKFVSDEKMNYYRKIMTEQKFRTEMLGEFVEDGGYVFTSTSGCVSDNEYKNPIYAGIDFGSGNGGDYTVLTLMNEEKKVVKIYAWNDIEPTRQIDLISDIINKEKALKIVNCEENSIGEVYISLLKKNVKKSSIIKKFHTDNASKKRIIENLQKAFSTGDITIPNDRELLRELEHYAQFKLTNNNYTYNAVSGFHDDYVMSLAICYDIFNTNVSYKNRIRI